MTQKHLSFKFKKKLIFNLYYWFWYFWVFLFIVFLLLGVMVIRSVFPRFRYDLVMELIWGVIYSLLMFSVLFIILI